MLVALFSLSCVIWKRFIVVLSVALAFLECTSSAKQFSFVHGYLEGFVPKEGSGVEFGVTRWFRAAVLTSKW